MSDNSKKDSNTNEAQMNSVDFIANLPAGFLVLNAEGTIVQSNEVAIDIMGIPADKLLGAPLAELLLPDFSEDFKSVLDNSVEEITTLPVRLANALKPVELNVGMHEDFHLVNVRSMASEYKLSAQACSELTHDQLTGLPDQYHTLTQLHAKINSANPKPISLLCIWIDELAGLTTSHGTRAVERVIQEVGDRLQQKLRAPDLLGRFDEAGFLALLTSDAQVEELTEIADRLRSEIAFPVNFDKKLVSFTASVAFASVTDKKPSIERVLALIEASGTRAANNGGNRTDILQF